jgi:hypothetical protein
MLLPPHPHSCRFRKVRALPSCRSAPPGVGLRHKASKGRAREPAPALGALRGALASRVRLGTGSLAPLCSRPLCRGAGIMLPSKVPLVSCLAGRRSRWGLRNQRVEKMCNSQHAPCIAASCKYDVGEVRYRHRGWIRHAVPTLAMAGAVERADNQFPSTCLLSSLRRSLGANDVDSPDSANPQISASCACPGFLAVLARPERRGRDRRDLVCPPIERSKD